MSKEKKALELEVVEDVVALEEVMPINAPTYIQAQQQISFKQMMEMSDMMAKSTIVPTTYRNRPENVFLALDLSNRIGVSPMAVMNGMEVINGRPSFSGSFMSALIKSSPLFSNVTLNWVGEPNSASWGCYVTATETRTGNLLKGTTITLQMAKNEGWLKNPKWVNLPELMLSYRAYSFFGRVHASELLSGIYDVDEMDDMRVRKQELFVKNPYES